MTNWKDTPEYQELDPKVQQIVDYFYENYENPAEAAQKMLEYMQKHGIKEDS